MKLKLLFHDKYLKFQTGNFFNVFSLIIMFNTKGNWAEKKNKDRGPILENTVLDVLMLFHARYVISKTCNLTFLLIHSFETWVISRVNCDNKIFVSTCHLQSPGPAFLVKFKDSFIAIQIRRQHKDISKSFHSRCHSNNNKSSAWNRIFKKNYCKTFWNVEEFQRPFKYGSSA